MVDVGRDVLAGASSSESSRDAYNVAIGRGKLLSQVDRVAGRVFEKAVDGRDLLADSNESSRGGVEASCSYPSNGGNVASGGAEHGEQLCLNTVSMKGNWVFRGYLCAQGSWNLGKTYNSYR